MGDTPGILHIVQRAAGVLPGQARILVLEQLHGNTHTGVSLFFHQASGDAGIHAAAHGNYCFHPGFL